MLSGDAEGRLRELLTGAGVALDAPSAEDVERAWTVMRAFADEHVEDVGPDKDCDGVLAEFGTWDWGQGEHFSVGLTRQFVFYDGDEYDHMAQLHCTFEYEPTAELQALGSGELWSFDMTLDAFFAQALAMEGFGAVRGLKPRRLELSYGDV